MAEATISIPMHKSYASVDTNSIVVKLFSDVFEKPTSADLLIGQGYGEEFVRPQNKYQLMDENQCFNYKIVDGKMVERTLEEKKTDISYIARAKQNKLHEVSNVCEQAIYAGIDVTTTKGIEHFSLKPEDQTNLSALVLEIGKGATTVPYHANGQLCRMFTADEFAAVFTAVKNFVTYNTTLCNHLNVWIRSCTTADEVNAITYTSKLPDDLQANMNAILGIKS